MTNHTTADVDVHLAHCNQGHYAGSCKYGEAGCPALAQSPTAPTVYTCNQCGTVEGAHASGLCAKCRTTAPEVTEMVERLDSLGPVMAVAQSGMRMVGEGSTPQAARSCPIMQISSDDHDEDALIDYVAWALNNRDLITRQAADLAELDELLLAAVGQITLHMEKGDDRAGYRLAQRVVDQIRAAQEQRRG